MRWPFLVFSAVIVLPGCGPGPEPQRPAPELQEPGAPRAEDARPVIAAFGDSLTEGFAVDPSHSYPAVLQQIGRAHV